MNKAPILSAILIAAIGLVFSPLKASAGSYVDNGVTFTLTALSPDELQVEITGATSPTGNWKTPSQIGYLQAFSLIPSSGTYTGATDTNNLGVHDGGISKGNMVTAGCDGTGAGLCFQASSPIALTSDMIFDVTFTGGTVDFSPTTHLKVCFFDKSTDTTCAGDLLSQDISVTSVPAPLAGAGLPGLIAACMGLFVLARRRRHGAFA
jgi:hypothetical protein